MSSAACAAGELCPGLVIAGRYRVDARLGEGGMGRVYTGTHLALGTQVALKVLQPDLAARREHVRRFVAEARHLAALSGDHVVRVFDAGFLDDGVPFLVMERLEGTDIAALIKACGRVGLGIAVDYVRQVCAGLAEVHACGMVHCDIKPSNLFLSTCASGAVRVKILDFGIAEVLRRRSARAEGGEVFGSPSYASPEQLDECAVVDRRSDIWSLGVVFFELLTGVRPFRRSSLGLVSLRAVLEGTPSVRQLPPKFARRLVAVVESCLEPDPNCRYATAEELSEALAPFASQALAALDRTREPLLLGRGGRPRATGTELHANA